MTQGLLSPCAAKPASESIRKQAVMLDSMQDFSTGGINLLAFVVVQ
jgi:hypothetical protein